MRSEDTRRRVGVRWTIGDVSPRGFSARLTSELDEQSARRERGARGACDAERRMTRGRVLLDCKRNYRTSIAVAPFSTRARPGGTVAVPLAWRELSAALAPDRFDVRSVPARLRRQRGDPWDDARVVGQRLRRGLVPELRRSRPNALLAPRAAD